MMLALVLCVFGTLAKEPGPESDKYMPDTVKMIEAATTEIQASRYMSRILSTIEATHEKIDVLRSAEETLTAVNSKRSFTLKDALDQVKSVKTRKKIYRTLQYSGVVKMKLIKSLPEFVEFSGDLTKMYPEFEIDLVNSVDPFDYNVMMGFMASSTMEDVIDFGMICSHMFDLMSPTFEMIWKLPVEFKYKKIGILVFKKLIMSIRDEINQKEASDLLGFGIGYAGKLMNMMDEKNPYYILLDTVKENAKFLIQDDCVDENGHRGLQKVQEVWKCIAHEIKESCRSGSLWNGSTYLKENLSMPKFDESGENIIYDHPITEAVEASTKQFSVAMDLSLIMMERYDIAKELEKYTLQKEKIYEQELCEKWTDLKVKMAGETEGANTVYKTVAKTLLQKAKKIRENTGRNEMIYKTMYDQIYLIKAENEKLDKKIAEYFQNL